jgi:two-component system OmpR family response regulator
VHFTDSGGRHKIVSRLLPWRFRASPKCRESGTSYPLAVECRGSACGLADAFHIRADPDSETGETTLAKVLLIEDDGATAEEVTRELERWGHAVTYVNSGISGLEAAHGCFDVLVVDRLLPGLEGLDVIRTLRSEGIRTPALVVSGLGRLDDRVLGLRAGADDYLAKPFALIELVVRLEALLRRPADTRETLLRLGPLELDLLKRTATRAGRTLDLQAREFELLEYLVRRPGRVVTRSMLLQDVWAYRFAPRSNVVDVHIGKLRRKLDTPDEAPMIRSVHGQGYRIDDPH